jgi:hypothetical protein
VSRPRTDFTKRITCPYCGHEDRDSWEHSEGGEMECGDCGRDFTFEVHTTVDYSTKRKDCDGEHVWGAIHAHRIDQALCDRWSADPRGVLRGKSPHTLWARECTACDDKDYATVEIDGACPWATDGHPAPTTTAAALLVESCAACGGTGDAAETGGGAS